MVAKRNDGFHNLETVFYPLEIKDALEFVAAKEMGLEVTGLSVAGNATDNLCMKAYELLKKDFPQIPALQIHLHKAIPMGAGLGGGSSNGAFMLMMLNEKFKLDLSQQQLVDYALQLGSDCPFFIYNSPCFATGRGEIMEPLNLDLSGYNILIVNPGIHVSTGLAFSGITPSAPKKSIKTIIKQPVEMWKSELVNDFEEGVFKTHPAIKEVKEKLYLSGASYASMTGTGSTVYGLFQRGLKINVSFPAKYLVIQLP
ncbi:MAG: 4-diphosphocytidyl-2-C-methyl-D-erythritol kinase [Segetibacter sp.]|nr:4-diphosphocytidyl-2-C-methyl-D-erythritol kinase [Segetibacter sp.]